MTKGGPALRTVVEPTKVASYTCGACGYGVSTSRLPPRCPMCGGRRWAPLVSSRAGSVRGFGL